MIIHIDGQDVLRNVTIFYNEKPCHACHAPSVRVNGKLIIDRSVQPTSVLISKVEIILAVFGILCLVVLVPFLSRILSKGLDKYINEILVEINGVVCFSTTSWSVSAIPLRWMN